MQPENICKKLWNLWINRKSLVEESIDYFDPKHKYWLQVSCIALLNTVCLSDMHKIIVF